MPLMISPTAKQLSVFHWVNIGVVFFAFLHLATPYVVLHNKFGISRAGDGWLYSYFCLQNGGGCHHAFHYYRGTGCGSWDFFNDFGESVAVSLIVGACGIWWALSAVNRWLDKMKNDHPYEPQDIDWKDRIARGLIQDRISFLNKKHPTWFLVVMLIVLLHLLILWIQIAVLFNGAPFCDFKVKYSGTGFHYGPAFYFALLPFLVLSAAFMYLIAAVPSDYLPDPDEEFQQRNAQHEAEDGGHAADTSIYGAAQQMQPQPEHFPPPPTYYESTRPPPQQPQAPWPRPARGTGPYGT